MNATAPLSRRERPAKPALTRAGIVDAAMMILQTEGLDKVTMRRVAAALDTGAASLYVYVRDTEDLHAEVLDALIGRVLAPPRRGGWRASLKALLKRYLELLLAHPEIAKMALSTVPTGTNYLSLVDQILGLLIKGGAHEQEAAWGVDLLLLSVTAQAAERSSWKRADAAIDNVERIASAIRGADPHVHPNVARLGVVLFSGGPERFEWQLDLMLTGLLMTPASRQREKAKA